MSRTTRLFLAGLAILALLPSAAGADDSGGAEHDREVDITFPVGGDVVFTDTYHAGRGGNSSECLEQGVEGRKHQATDIMADKMQKVFAAQSGVVTWAPETEPSYGWMISIDGDDGLEYHYVHLNNDAPGTDDGQGGIDRAYAPGVRTGVRVERGQHIGWVGDSGNAEAVAPQLHFEIEDPDLEDPTLVCPLQSERMNPYPSLRSALDRGDLPASRPSADHDVSAAPSGWIFDDVAPDATHAESIEALVVAGVTFGCTETDFCPSRVVTRDQMASFIARATGTPLDGTIALADVPETAVHAEAIAALLTNGVAELCGPERFCPRDGLTRDDMAVWLANALGISGGEATFDDVPADARYADAVAAIADLGVTVGCTPTRFCPDETVTRAQMASFFVRAFLSG